MQLFGLPWTTVVSTVLAVLLVWWYWFSNNNKVSLSANPANGEEDNNMNEEHRRARLARLDRKKPPAVSSDATKENKQDEKPATTVSSNNNSAAASKKPSGATTGGGATRPSSSSSSSKEDIAPASPPKKQKSNPKTPPTTTSSTTLKKTPPSSSSPASKPDTSSSSSTKKKKRRRLRLAPTQVLSQALSHVWNCDIVVQVEEGDNAQQQDSSTSNKATSKPKHLVLLLPATAISTSDNNSPLDDDDDAKYEQDWTRLADAFCRGLLSTALGSKLAVAKSNNNTSTSSMRTWVDRHARLQLVLRDGWKHQQYSALNRSLQALSQQVLIPAVVSALSDDVRNNSQHSSSSSFDDDDAMDDDDGGLFAQDYSSAAPMGTTTANNNNNAGCSGPVQELLHLLEEPVPAVSAQFWQEVFAAATTTSNNKKEESEPVDLVTFFVQHVLQQRMLSSSSSSLSATTLQFSFPIHLQQRLNAWIHLLQATAVGPVLASRIDTEVEQVTDATGGMGWQQMAWLAPLVAASAYSLPAAGAEQPDIIAGNSTSSATLYGRQLAQHVSNYPVGIFEPTHGQAYTKVRDECRRLQGAARQAAASTLRVVFKHASNKSTVFTWWRQVAQQNQAMAALAKPDLLNSDATATCSSRAFLMGASHVLVHFCRTNLMTRFAQQGAGAFDVHYMQVHQNDLFSCHTAPLFPAAANTSDNKGLTKTTTNQPAKPFSGATEFFFLSCALLRVGLYPVLRMQDEFLYRYNSHLDTVEGAAHSNNKTLSPHLSLQLTPVVTAWLGFRACLEDPEYVTTMTDFCLLQLEWLHAVIVEANKNNSNNENNRNATRMIPDWMCKEPSQWLSFAARHAWHLLRPHQAEKAVEVATGLLQLGTTTTTANQKDSGGTAASSSFSPIVVTALVRIAASYVQASVDRARQKQRQQQRRRRRFGNAALDDDDYEPDDDDVDIYLSFDQNDLGVAVFTNARAQTDLCPTLMQAFQSLDIVEGLDVDREHAFDKFQVKLEITELFLRLWSHPNGKCRQSVLNLAPDRVAHFASSISAAIGYLLDDACLRMSDVCKFSNRPKTQYTSQRDKQFQESQARLAVGNFASARKLLLLLVRLSQEPSLAGILGGRLGGGDSATAAAKEATTKKVTTASDLAIMVIHFLDLMTSAEGGTHVDLEYERDPAASVSTATLFASSNTMVASEKARLATTLAKSRYLAKSRLGFDAATMSHQFLALATRWHHSANSATMQEDPNHSSSTSRPETPFLLAMADHDDCDVARYEKIVERLIDLPRELVGSEVENAATIFKHDGYVPCTNWAANYDEPAAQRSSSDKRNRQRARRNQMSPFEISTLSSDQEISAFLSDLKVCVDRKRSAMSSKLVPADQVPVVERQILESGQGSQDLTEEEYGKVLSEWTISSSPFANQTTDDATSFAHFYDSTARSHGAAGSGKVLVKEARRCHKTLPRPHPNSATFICYAEERMDLCRAIVTGPVDTPYALGVFVFDVYYPVHFPRIPPLMTFMTTGGGQTRFGPNLYQDGKVCLSLLGTFHALDDSERWNEQLSSLAQILLSIQTQLLVKEPYFNEPGAERMKGTASGDASSLRYNAGLRLATLRHAVLQPLRNPPAGFEEVTLRHFSMCRKRLVAQAKRWMLEAKGSSLFPRFVQVFGELLLLLSSTKGIDRYQSLPPLADDLAALARLDPGFSYKGDDGDRKPSASTTSSSMNGAIAGGENWNPWASQAPNMSAPGALGAAGISEEDEELYT